MPLVHLGMAKKIDSGAAEKILVKVGLTPLEPYKNSTQKWKSKCDKCKEINFRSLKSIKKHKNGCVFCSGKRVNPEKALQWMRDNELEPLVPYPGGHKPWKCRCLKCSRTVSPSYKSPGQKKKPACAYCSKVRVVESDVIKRMLKNGYQPLEPYVNSITPWKCKCLKCGRIGHPRWSQVQWYDSKCQYCVGNKITDKQAIRVMRAAGYLPLEPYVSSKVKWKSKHIKCGSIVAPKLNTITTGTGGCRNCSVIGFEVNKAGYLYFIYHPELLSFKVGISNDDSKPNRIKVHGKSGWEVVRIFNFESGWEAMRLETEFFNWLRRERKISPHLSKYEMSQGGWYETFAEDEITQFEVLKEIKKLIRSSSTKRI
jgi:hypothetical protein